MHLHKGYALFVGLLVVLCIVIAATCIIILKSSRVSNTLNVDINKQPRSETARTHDTMPATSAARLADGVPKIITPYNAPTTLNNVKDSLHESDRKTIDRAKEFEDAQ